MSDEEENVVLELDRPERLADQQARFVWQRTKEQLSSRKMKVGFHHGHFNVLPASWRYPHTLTVIQLINIWLIGMEKEHVPPLRKINSIHVEHFDKGRRIYSKMKKVMLQVEQFARLEGVWLQGGWTAAAVPTM